MNFDKYKNKFDYVTQREEYSKEEGRIHQEFYDDALRETGLTGHPKAGKIFAKAWEDGHSYGFQEVFIHLQNLAELFED